MNNYLISNYMWLQDNYKLLLITLSIVLIIDFIYLNLNKSMYAPILSSSSLNIKYGFIAWSFIAFTISYFIISNPNWTNQQKIMNAFILGLCIYGIYNFTNIAILPNWTNKILIVDTLWGASLFAIITFILLYLRDTYKLF